MAQQKQNEADSAPSSEEQQEIRRHTYLAAVRFFLHKTAAHEATYKNHLEIHQRKLGYPFEPKEAQDEAARLLTAKRSAQRQRYKQNRQARHG